MRDDSIITLKFWGNEKWKPIFQCISITNKNEIKMKSTIINKKKGIFRKMLKYHLLNNIKNIQRISI